MHIKKLTRALACVVILALAVMMTACGSGVEMKDFSVAAPSWETQTASLGGVSFELPASWVKSDQLSTSTLYLYIPGDVDLTKGGSSNVNVTSLGDGKAASIKAMAKQLPPEIKKTMEAQGATDLSEITVYGVKAPIGEVLVLQYSFKLNGLSMSQTMYYPAVKNAAAVNLTQLEGATDSPSANEVAEHIIASMKAE